MSSLYDNVVCLYKKNQVSSISCLNRCQPLQISFMFKYWYDYCSNFMTLYYLFIHFCNQVNIDRDFSFIHLFDSPAEIQKMKQTKRSNLKQVLDKKRESLPIIFSSPPLILIPFLILLLLPNRRMCHFLLHKYSLES